MKQQKYYIYKLKHGKKKSLFKFTLHARLCNVSASTFLPSTQSLQSARRIFFFFKRQQQNPSTNVFEFNKKKKQTKFRAAYGFMISLVSVSLKLINHLFWFFRFDFFWNWQSPFTNCFLCDGVYKALDLTNRGQLPDSQYESTLFCCCCSWKTCSRWTRSFRLILFR